MQFWRVHRTLARGVLLWFLLTLGSAIASPWLIQTPQQQWVCSAGGLMRMVAPADDGSLPVQAQGIECPLCVSPIAPPPAARLPELPQLATPAPEGNRHEGRPSTRLRAALARGPPGSAIVL